MKKLMMMAVAGLLFSGAAFAGGKNCKEKDKECCKKEQKESKEKKAEKETKKEKASTPATSKA